MKTEPYGIMQKTALHNQSAFDYCLQHTGSVSGIIEFADRNGLSITDELKAGDSFEPGIVEDVEIYSYFKNKSAIPATAITEVEINEIETLGIGAMIVGTSFIIR